MHRTLKLIPFLAVASLAYSGTFATAQGSQAVDEHRDHAHAEQQADEPGAKRYTCPMHPEIVRDAPGTCPICKMKLVPAKEPPKK